MKNAAGISALAGILSLMLPTYVGGFTSCPKFIDQNGILQKLCESGHLDITRIALESNLIGLSGDAVQRIAEAVIGVDRSEMALIDINKTGIRVLFPKKSYNRVHHFDRPL